MMKKLLILMLVLGVVSASYAAQVSFSASDVKLKLDEGTDTLYLEWVANAPASGDTVDGGIFEEQSPSQGTFSGTATLLGSPKTSGFLGNAALNTTYNGVDFGGGSQGSESPPHDAALGDWFSITYSGSVGDSIALYDYSQSTYTAIGTLIVQVPEPMTIALLSLGGLFLRRRK
jgi:hypothetical protein